MSVSVPGTKRTLVTKVSNVVRSSDGRARLLGVLGLWVFLANTLSLVASGYTPVVKDALVIGVCLVALAYAYRTPRMGYRWLASICFLTLALTATVGVATVARGRRPWARVPRYALLSNWPMRHEFLVREGLHPFRIGDMETLYLRIEQGSPTWTEAQHRLSECRPTATRSASIVCRVFLRFVLLPPVSYLRWRRSMLALDPSEQRAFVRETIAARKGAARGGPDEWVIKDSTGRALASDSIGEWTARIFAGASPR